eukprot:scaffold435834_cov41-Prasinocladus_malaysianus.AAC.1
MPVEVLLKWQHIYAVDVVWVRHPLFQPRGARAGKDVKVTIGGSAPAQLGHPGHVPGRVHPDWMARHGRHQAVLDVL